MVFPDYESGELQADYHAVVSVQLCELINGGWLDWNDDSWHWSAYNDEQYKRVCKKFNDRYYFREIGILPPLQWKMELLRKFNEIMPKYIPAYKALESGSNILASENRYGKHRNVFSDFPATQLKSETQDYASNATDNQYEDIVIGDWIETLNRLKDYNDIDVMILNELDSMFSTWFTVNTNAF